MNCFCKGRIGLDFFLSQIEAQLAIFLVEVAAIAIVEAHATLACKSENQVITGQGRDTSEKGNARHASVLH